MLKILLCSSFSSGGIFFHNILLAAVSPYSYHKADNYCNNPGINQLHEEGICLLGKPSQRHVLICAREAACFWVVAQQHSIKIIPQRKLQLGISCPDDKQYSVARVPVNHEGEPPAIRPFACLTVNFVPGHCIHHS